MILILLRIQRRQPNQFLFLMISLINLFTFSVFSYLSNEKVQYIESDIHDLFNSYERNSKMLNIWINRYKERTEARAQKYDELRDKYNILKIKYDDLNEEHKNNIRQFDEFKEDTTKKLKSIEKMISQIIKLNTEDILELENTEKSLSSLLEEVYANTEVFEPAKHFKLIDTYEKTLKELCNQEITQTLGENEFILLKESMIDFLFKLKDNHPFSNPEKKETMDVLDRIMQLMADNNFKPSNKLQIIYSQSETTRNLNEFPSFEYLNKMIGIEIEIYDKLKLRYQSQPAFVYYLNINCKMHSDANLSKCGKYITIQYFPKEIDSQIKAGIRIYNDGGLQQGFFKNDKIEYFGRTFFSNGNYYIGGWRHENKNGLGEYNWKSGGKEIGYRVNDKKEGLFKYYDKEGKQQNRVYKNGKLVKQ